jgi:hypothetical protein
MPGITQNLRERAIGMLNAGMTMKAVAMNFGCSTRAIRHHIQVLENRIAYCAHKSVRLVSMVADLCHSCFRPVTPPSEKSRIDNLKWRGRGAKHAN